MGGQTAALVAMSWEVARQRGVARAPRAMAFSRGKAGLSCSKFVRSCANSGRVRENSALGQEESGTYRYMYGLLPAIFSAERSFYPQRS